MNQHVRCLYADAHDTGEEMNHDMRLVLRSLLQALRTGLLNLFDLVHDEPQAGHVATKFEQRVGRERPPSGVRSAVRRSGALRNVGLKVRTPKRTKHPFIRLTRRVRSRTSPSRSRLGRLASSSASVGMAAMWQ